MDLFSNKPPKVEKENIPQNIPKKTLVSFNKSDELPPLPANWREKINEAVNFLTQIRDYGSKIPQKYNMTKEEFEKFTDTPGNFSKEDWEILHKAKEDMRHFVSQMKDILKNYKVVKSSSKKRPPHTRGWISVD